MTKKTSIDELYVTIGLIVKGTTGRDWWKKLGIQSTPNTPFATVYITNAKGVENDVVETVDQFALPVGYLGQPFMQIPWGTSRLEVKVEFVKAAVNDRAYEAATRFKNALRLEERFWDLWNICGLSGGVDIIDLSDIFRADVEPRAQVIFNINANIADPNPLIGNLIWDIDTQTVNVIHVRQDGKETHITVDVENTLEGS